MKKSILTVLLIAIGSMSAYSSHLMGGEITWKNYGSGKFIFETKLYRDCNGISAPSNILLQSNAPGQQAGILCSFSSTADISPLGPGCPTCANPFGFLNAVQEIVYRSDTVVITGLPPSSGWHFLYTSCCRNAGIVNLANGPGDFCLRAFMYPYNNIPVELTNDNSPSFAVRPSLAACSKILTNYNHTAFDQDLDSLFFEWAQPLTTSPTAPAYPFAGGYSYTSPLPSSLQNPLNVPAVLNSQTGNITFTSYTPGAFVTVVKVSSYKCGVLVAEVFREIQIAIVNDCILSSTPTITYNKNPNFSVGSIIALNGYFSDTLLAGDSIHYVLNALDADAVAGTSQIVTCMGYGNHFGTNFSDATSGCLIPPCATTTPALPTSGSILNSFNFDWKTSCAHASNVNGCLQHLRTFLFTFNSNDNYCPANGVSSLTLALSVSGPVLQTSGADLYISAPGSTFQWYLDGVAIAGATDSIYTPTVQGIYSVMATNGNGCSLISNALPRTFTSIESTSIKEFTMNIAPNPIDKNGLSLLISSPSAIQMNVQIVDQLGRSVYNQVVNMNEGDQHIILDPGILATGIYTIQMMNGKNSIEKKFVVN